MNLQACTNAGAESNGYNRADGICSWPFQPNPICWRSPAIGPGSIPRTCPPHCRSKSANGRWIFARDYLPRNWQSRLASLGRFGQLDVRRADPRDIFVGKRFSRREKDRDDLRALANQFDKPSVVQLLLDDSQSLLGEPGGLAQARKNWCILDGEPLHPSRRQLTIFRISL